MIQSPLPLTITLLTINQNKLFFNAVCVCSYIINFVSGDHVAVYPINDINLVEQLGKLTSANLDEVFSLINTDQESSKKHPFPCPTTYRTALSHYIEITALPRTHILRELAEYCTDEEVNNFVIHY